MSRNSLLEASTKSEGEVTATGLKTSCSYFTFRFRACFEKEFLDIQATIECGFTLKHVRDMTRRYSQIMVSLSHSMSNHLEVPW